MNSQNRLINFNCTNGLISNPNGQLLFASNGVFIQNANNDTMQNGSNLNPAFWTTQRGSRGLTIPQANLVIPFPGDSTKYYLFHETCDDYSHSFCSFFLYYSIVDMTIDNGLGGVVQKNTILLNDSLVEGRLTACKHANGRDWWLIAHHFLTDQYYKYLITPDSILGPYNQNIGEIRHTYFGQCLFSPDGKMFAYYEPIMGDLDIFDFDRCTGNFTMKAHVDINDSANGGGVSFSPNSNVLYVSSTYYVYQFDLTSANIVSTIDTIAVYDGFNSPQFPQQTLFYLSYLAPDGKIYINCSNSTEDIHVINYPDSLGIACDVCQHCIHLPATNAYTIPNYPNYFLGAEGGSVCDSLPTNISIVEKENSLRIFPNPVSDQDVTFNYTVSEKISELIINNIEGKQVAKYSLPKWSSMQKIKLPFLSPGIYVARLINVNAKADVKFVVE